MNFGITTPAWVGIAGVRLGGAFPLRRPTRCATIPIMLPRGWDRRTIVLLTFALLFVISTNLAPAQVFDLDRDRVPMVELNGLMRFHTGDDPDGKLGWADPNFNDSSWSLLHGDRGWFNQGYRGYSGFGWYRFEVNLPAKHGPLALYIPRIWAVYQVYANGRLIGEVGRMPPHERVIESHWLLFPIPESLVAQQRQIAFAIRVWNQPYGSSYGGGGPDQPLRIGDTATLSEWRSLHIKQAFWSVANSEIFLTLLLLFGFGAVVLFMFRPAEREYLWYGVMSLFSAASWILILHTVFDQYWIPRTWILLGCLAFGNQISYVFFTRALLKERFSLLYWVAASFSLLIGITYLVDQLQLVSFSFILLMYPLTNFLSDLCVLYLLYLGAKRGNQDARLLLIPASFSILFHLLSQGRLLLDLFGYHYLRLLLNRVYQPLDWPFPFDLEWVSELLYMLVVAGIVLFRFVRTRRDEERFRAELDAARTVQQVLIPEEIPTIPGLALECIYKPAGQVGGDFFQILPTPSGGALIVIGDVSGKGMPAAMAVSLLVGTVRTLAHYTQSPAEILTAMNQRMLGRSKDGFTTCLVLRLDRDGAATVANAGHLAPYLGSEEVPVESGLPLGLAAQAEYTESSFQFDTGEQLTLITDGVAEARAKTGELFGFERTASIATLSAAHIAATAAAFGQQDDITVLKIRRVPVPEPALAGPAALPSTTPSTVTTFL
jgi:Stage II sporulation protein E (SpoIIE)